MSNNRVLPRAFGFALLLVTGFFFALPSAHLLAAPRPADAKADADREVLKMNEECNAAELKGDVATMGGCETDDFEHIHANGMVEHKAEFLKGVGSGAHKFLALDLSDNSGKIADVNNIVMTVWTKQQGKWREAAWMAVGLPKPGAPGSN